MMRFSMKILFPLMPIKPLQHRTLGKEVSFHLFLSFMLTLPVLFTSCSEEPDIEADLPRSGSQIGAAYTDTFSLLTRTVRIDSVRTDQSFRMPLGDYNDPIFGVSKASMVTQFELSNPGVSFAGGNLEYDSLVLSLGYGTTGQGGSFYSRKTGTGSVDLDEQSFKVYAVSTNNFTAEDTIFSDGTIRNNGIKGTLQYDLNEPVGEITTKPRVGRSDSVFIDGEAFAPHLRIRLDDDFGRNLFNAPTSIFSSNQAFRDFFPGLVIVPDNNFSAPNGQILFIDPAAAISRLTLFYTNTSTEGGARETYFFEINNDVPRFSLFEKDYTSTNVQQAISHSGRDDFSGGSEKVYVQGLSGVRAEVRVPHLLKAFPVESDFIINKAELILPVAQRSNDPFPAIPQFNIAARTEDGRLTIVADIVEGFGHLDGNLNQIEGEYRFNLTRHVHRLLEQDRRGINENFGFVIVAANEQVNAARTTLKGFNVQSGKTPRFEIYYTPLND